MTPSPKNIDHDGVAAKIDAMLEAEGVSTGVRQLVQVLAAERHRYWDALDDIASDLGMPTPDDQDPWYVAMVAIGKDPHAAYEAWED